MPNLPSALGINKVISYVISEINTGVSFCLSLQLAQCDFFCQNSHIYIVTLFHTVTANTHGSNVKQIVVGNRWKHLSDSDTNFL